MQYQEHINYQLVYQGINLIINSLLLVFMLKKEVSHLTKEQVQINMLKIKEDLAQINVQTTEFVILLLELAHVI